MKPVLTPEEIISDWSKVKFFNIGLLEFVNLHCSRPLTSTTGPENNHS